MGLKEAESIDFKYTTMSLDDVYDIGYKHALRNIQNNGGNEKGEIITINYQQPTPVKLEKNFPGLYPVDKIPVKWSAAKDEISFEFTGTGFVLKGETADWASTSDYIYQIELYIDEKLVESPKLPTNFTARRHELCWKYDLPKAKHTVRLKIINPSTDIKFRSHEAIIYSDHAVSGIQTNERASKVYRLP
jgi:hypothetical protein